MAAVRPVFLVVDLSSKLSLWKFFGGTGRLRFTVSSEMGILLGPGPFQNYFVTSRFEISPTRTAVCQSLNQLEIDF